MASAVCLFAMHAPDGRLSGAVLHYLGQLAGCGLAVHVALSGMAAMHSQDQAALGAIGATGHCRENAGLDFGAWQHLASLGCINNAEFVVLANDSVFGPLRPLSPIFSRMQEIGADVWGMVESHEVAWHLQSWFLCFTRAAWNTPAIARVMALPYRDMTKREIVLHGEVGLGAAIRAAGLDWAACQPDHRRGLRKLIATNPMHLDWLSFVREGDVPFIKMELLRDNPMLIPWLHRWPAMVGRSAIFRPDWIRERIVPQEAGQRPSLAMHLLYMMLTRDRPAALRALWPYR
ncbi:rhamnan synthesis F family protein [Lichenicoccus roseus]|uniref:Glycosyl transferase n=1 Tax=Lichenicoccus roseus TaxID=2683649 RepID=A0A5R9J1J5_9PROT|nr:rhamnan synthesis F family protein [Lichenicoccus roseus]TLU70819.1 hypothetical protein FE263_19715 [Lichenicoccus roseus]